MATLELPRHVDDPPNLLFWRIDDVTPFFLVLVIGILGPYRAPLASH